MGHADSPREAHGAAAPPRVRSPYAHPVLDALFDFSPDAILIADARGEMRYANSRVGEMFGYAATELVGKPVEMLVPKRLRGGHLRHRENYEAAPRTRPMGAAANLFGLRKDGSEFPIDILLKPIDTPDGPAVVSFIRDVTEQRAAEEKLREYDLRLRAVLDNVHDYSIFLLDREGRVMTWNSGAARLTGYRADEVIGSHFSRFYLQEDVDRGHPAELLRVTAEQGRVETEGWRVRRDGSRFWTNTVLTAIRGAAGEPAGFSLISRDVSERRLAQESVLVELSNVLLSNLDVRKLLGAFSSSLRQTVPHDAATLGLYDAQKGKLHVQFFAEMERGDDASGELFLDPETSPAGQAFRTGQAVIVEQFARSAFPPETVQHHTRLGMKSAVFVPLRHRERILGALAVSSRRESAFTRRDAELLGHVAAQISMALNNALTLRQINDLRDRLDRDKQYIEEEIDLEHRFDDIVGESSSLRGVLREIETVAPTDATVLILGETGTGKELVARAIHRLSPRAERTFIRLNCAAIPAGLLESELFGHEKGAFTGAIARKIGRLELAHEGTLFLDEIGELPLDLQPKLLRALQEREIERVGGSRPIAVNVRLIAASNRDLARMVVSNQFRGDLYYRLKVFPVSIPPLRERAGDIPMLVRHFVERHSRRMGKTIAVIPPEAMAALTRWKWPGNIRELENFLERSVILSRGPILHVPLAELEMLENEDADSGVPNGATAIHTIAEHAAADNPTLRAAEREHILRALREAKGVVGAAAATLGLKRTTLHSKMKKLGIERGEYF